MRTPSAFPLLAFLLPAAASGQKLNPAQRSLRIGPDRGVSDQYLWASPPETKLRGYQTLADLNAATGQEAHGVELDYDIFENLRAPDPAKPRAVYHAEDLDFRLRPGGKAVDAGVRLPNVNDDFTGQAPDLGALEAGKPAPVYGPRRTARQSFYR